MRVLHLTRLLPFAGLLTLADARASFYASYEKRETQLEARQSPVDHGGEYVPSPGSSMYSRMSDEAECSP